MNVLKTIELFEMPEEVKSIFKIKNDSMFFAIPKEDVKKYNFEKLRIIELDNKKIIVGPNWNQDTNHSNPSSLKHEVTDIGK